MPEPPGAHDPDGVVMAALRAACPSFEPVWADHVADWAEHPDARGVYIDVATFAHHLVTLLGRGETTEFPRVFGAVERLYGSGDAGIRYLLTIGLLEAIQNIALNGPGPAFAARFRLWLGPLATAGWNEVHRFWGTADG